MYALGGWYCRWCQPGEFCFNNTNRTCPVHSTSFGVSKSYSDCYCNPGYKNTTTRTEANFCEDCPANYYCTGKGAVDKCVTNALSPSQSTDPTRCYCDLGWKGVNNSVCIACQSPKYCYSGLEATCSEGTLSPPLSFDRLNCSCIPGELALLSPRLYVFLTFFILRTVGTQRWSLYSLLGGEVQSVYRMQGLLQHHRH